jgi:predicted nucleic acid-binding Zn ribbon protein
LAQKRATLCLLVMLGVSFYKRGIAMALIICPECGKKISESADSCPKCGYLLTPEIAEKIKKRQKEGEIIGGVITLAIIIVVVFIFNNDESSNSTKSVLNVLGEYGNAVTKASGEAVIYISSEQTTKSPLNAYKIYFKTDREELMSVSGAEYGNAEYFTNAGITKVWTERFCTQQLKEIISQYEIDLVSGDLSDFNGETQRVAVCTGEN